MNRIEDYALIGDCHSVALVGRDAAIDWACFPRFDSPAIFGALLDPECGGSLTVAVEGATPASRSYLDDTNVIVTRFEGDGGKLEVTDCMPVEPLDPSRPTDVTARHSILRRLACTHGEVEVSVGVAPRFEYGLFVPRFRVLAAGCAEIVGGADSLWVSATEPLEREDEAVRGRWRLRSGDEAWIEVAWAPSHELRPDAATPAPDELERLLANTVAFWRTWMKSCWYEGDYEDAVRRSALTLKALTYSPSGAVIAAPTTSLPEEIGGIRNWDYRYTWIRDATLTLTSLFVLGFRDEAASFKSWLERTGAGRPQDLQIMYGICGERSLPERELTHLSGHRASGPVRIGNGAVKQMQHDAFGQILEAGYLYARAGGELDRDNWRFLSGLADMVCERWRDPDHGIWEMRDAPRHFVHSKLNCWITLDRALQLAPRFGSDERVARWRSERDALRAYLMTEAAPDGWFHQAVGVSVPDASTLLVPASGFLPVGHPLVEKTIDVVMRDLSDGGLVHRYRADDGLSGGEGAFMLCSFWLVDCLIYAGRLDEATVLLERLLALANDVGLFAEEADPSSGEPLGNFPQAFTHMAVVLSCAHLSAARRGQLPDGDGPHDFAELALDRLLAAGDRVAGVK